MESNRNENMDDKVVNGRFRKQIICTKCGKSTNSFCIREGKYVCLNCKNGKPKVVYNKLRHFFFG